MRIRPPGYGRLLSVRPSLRRPPPDPMMRGSPVSDTSAAPPIHPTAVVHPTAEVEEGASVGAGTRIWHLGHVRGTATIGSGCNLGRNVYVDSHVTIGSAVKIQNNVSVYQGVTIEDDVFVGPCAVFTNDLRPRAQATEWAVTPTLVRTGASIGANATIVCGVTI